MEKDKTIFVIRTTIIGGKRRFYIYNEDESKLLLFTFSEKEAKRYEELGRVLWI